MRIYPAVAAVLLAGIVVGDEPRPTIDHARKVYEQQLSWADAQFNMTVTEAKRKRDGAAKAAQVEYVQKLKIALDAALKSKDLDTANNISAAIKNADTAVESNPLAAIEGTWLLTYTNNVKRTYQFNRTGEGRYVEEFRDGRRERPGLKCQASVQGKDILIDWGDGKIERVSVLGNRAMFEHFVPASRFAAGQHAEVIAVGVKR